MADLILRGGTVVTMDRQRRVIEDGVVAITGGKIDFVGTEPEAQGLTAMREIDCRGHIVLPGLVDAHGHAGHSFTRFTVKDTRYWMPAMTHMYKHYVDDDFWYVEGKLQALQRLKGGVTTAVCVMGSQPRCDSPVHAINNAKGYAQVGVRDIVCTGPNHTPWPHNFSRWENGKRMRKAVTFDEVCDSLEQVIQTLNRPGDYQTQAFVAPFGIITSIDPSDATPLDKLTQITPHDIRQAKEMRRIADKYCVRIHSDCFGGMLHLAAQDKGSALVGSDVHLQHCTNLSDFEIDFMAQTGTHAAVAPNSRAPVHRMLDAGVNVVVTSDGPGDGYDMDMFAAMRLFQRNYRQGLENKVDLIPYETLLEMCTINAAKALGMENLVGSLEAGKLADVITVDLMNPRLMPAYNHAQMPALSVQNSDVDNVIIGGKVLMENRRVSHVDEAKLYDECQAMSDEINARAHFDGFVERPLVWGQSRFPKTGSDPFDIEWQRKDGGHY